LAIVGPDGSGKRSLSEILAAEILNLTDEKKLSSQPFIRIIEPENISVSIEQIRGLINFTKLKIAGATNGIKRVAIIDKAGSMTAEAQNALLKLLEEPPTDTVLILNTANAEALLPTVRSRSQQLVVKQPPRQNLESFFLASGFSLKQIQSAYMMSGGLPGLMHAMLTEESDHPLVHAAAQARELLKSTAFERLCTVDTLAKQKTDCTNLLFILQQMSRAALDNAAITGAQDRTYKQWHRILRSAYDAEAALHNQAQAKLTLTNFMLAL
jgi:DNA polymerase-3 subunit delta'